MFLDEVSGLLHKRLSTSPSNVVTNLEERIPFRNEQPHSLHGYIKTINSKNVTLEARYFSGRTNESLYTASINDSINGNNEWKRYWGQIPKIENAEFIDVRINSDIPDSGTSYSYFDDVGLIEWDSLHVISISHINFVSKFL